MNSRMITRLTMAALAATLIPSLASSIAHARESDDRPNIIVFFLDDSGYGDYAHNGNPTIRTPNISRLAQDGMNFTQFYVASPACSASRYSLLTGRYPGRSGLGLWVIGQGLNNTFIPGKSPSLRVLKRKVTRLGSLANGIWVTPIKAISCLKTPCLWLTALTSGRGPMSHTIIATRC